MSKIEMLPVLLIVIIFFILLLFSKKKKKNSDSIPKLIKPRNKLGYFLGFVSLGLLMVGFNAYFAGYVVSISFEASYIISISYFVNIVLSLVVGVLLDKYSYKYKNPNSKFIPLYKIGAIIILISLIILFILPLNAGIMFIVLIKLLFDLGANISTISLGGLLAKITNNDKNRTIVTLAKVFADIIVNILFIIISGLMIYDENNIINYDKLFQLMVILGVCALIISIPLTSLIKEDINDETKMVEFKDLFILFKDNKAIIPLLVNGLVLSIASQLSQTVIMQNYLNLSGTYNALVIIIPVITIVLTVFAKRMKVNKVVEITSMISFILFTLLYVVEYLIGLSSDIFIILFSISTGFTIVPSILIYPLVAEITNYNESINNKRMECSIYGLFNCSRLFSTTIITSVLMNIISKISGYHMDIIDYDGAMKYLSTSAIVIAIISLIVWLIYKYLWKFKEIVVEDDNNNNDDNIDNIDSLLIEPEENKDEVSSLLDQIKDNLSSM